MKKIIDGKRYDTDAAKEIGYASHGYRSDFGYWEETLFRKRTGEFFLHGYGHAASKYAENIGQNEWAPGERLMPLSLEAAQKWAEKNLNADEYEEIFGKIEESDERRTVTFSLPEAVIEKIARLASARGISKSDIVAEAIEAIDKR